MPAKEPGSKRDYGFDYAAEVGADAITASEWTADEGLTLTGDTFDDTSTSVWIEGGEEGQTLTATNRVTTAAGRTYERVLTLVIRAAADERDDYLAIAADIVQDLAPAPDPVTPAYSSRAARAERLLANWLKQTGGGTLKSEAVDEVSSSFSEMAAVRNIVAAAMGSFYVDPDARAADAFTLDVASTFPEPAA